MLMEYSDKEKQILSLMQRTDFKNLSKRDAMNIYSQLNQLRPEVAKQILVQFPEFMKLIKPILTEYKNILASIIASDDKSSERVSSIAKKDIDDDACSRKQYYDFAGKVHSDISKCLEKSISPEEKEKLLDREMEIFRLVGEKDTEIRESRKETVQMVNKKDSEKRQFNWGIIRSASWLLGIAVGIGASYFGGPKIPKK